MIYNKKTLAFLYIKKQKNSKMNKVLLYKQVPSFYFGYLFLSIIEKKLRSHFSEAKFEGSNKWPGWKGMMTFDAVLHASLNIDYLVWYLLFWNVRKA